MIKKFVNDIYLDITLIIFLAIIAISRWHSGIDQILGMTLCIVSMVFWVRARAQLGDSFSVRPKATTLIESGIYAKIRHPIYLFSSLCVLGLVMAIHYFSFYLLWVVLVMLQFLRAKKEEEILSAKFGQSYEAYKRGTWF